jgi:hypothetical protein
MVNFEIARGFHVPFFPMRPTLGRDLRTRQSVVSLWKEIESEVWVGQPKLNGDGVSLAVYKRRVYLFNRYGRAYRFKVLNAPDYLKLPDGTCFVGEVFKRNFYPYEALALAGESLLATTVVERVKWAKDHVDFLKHPWMFPQPNFGWMVRRRANMPIYDGVVLKKTASAYRLLGSADQTSLDWFKRRW